MKLKNKLEVEETLEVGVLPNAPTNNFSVIFETVGMFQRRQVGNIINKNDTDFLPSVSNSFPTSVFAFNVSTTNANPNLTVSFVNQVAGTVFAAPQSLNGTPAFRMLQDSDLSQTSLGNKQDALTVGDHIDITGDVISVKPTLNTWIEDSGDNNRILMSTVSSGTNHNDMVIKQISSDGFLKLRNAQDEDFFVYKNSTQEVMMPLVGTSTGTSSNILTMGSNGAIWKSNRTIGDFALASQVPTNYITTDTTQTGLSGDKESTGNWSLRTLLLSGQIGGSILISRDIGGLSIETTRDTSMAEMIIRHKWLAKNVTFGIGGISSTTSGSMVSWGLNRWLNDRTVNGSDGFFGWTDDTDQLRASSLAGAGDRIVYANSNGDLLNRPVSDFALASSIITPNNGLLTISTSSDLTGGGTFSADQATASNIDIGLSATVLSDIGLGVTANSWGRGLRVDGNGILIHNDTTGDTSDIRNASMYARGINKPSTGNGSVVNFTPYSSSDGYYGFDMYMAAVSDRFFIRRETASVKQNWIEVIHEDNLDSQATSLGFVKSSALPTVNDGQLTLTTGTGLSGSANFTANQSGNSSFSVEIASTHTLPTNAQVTQWNNAISAANLALGTRTATTMPITNSGGTGVALPIATTTLAGLMSGDDKDKLNNIASNANNYVHPNSGVSAGTYNQVTVNAQGHVTAGNNQPYQTGTQVDNAINTAIEPIVDGVIFHSVPTTAPLNIQITTKKTIINVATGVISANITVRDGLYDGYELAINGCGEWSINLIGKVRDACMSTSPITISGNSLFWWSAGEDMWIQAI